MENPLGVYFQGLFSKGYVSFRECTFKKKVEVNQGLKPCEFLIGIPVGMMAVVEMVNV